MPMSDGAHSTPPPPHSTAGTMAALVAQIQLAVGPLDDALASAFLKVDRADFLPAAHPDQAYHDAAVPVKAAVDGVVISQASQPSMMAVMLRQLELRPGDNVLEIGTGTGYNAALIQAAMGGGGRVTSVEVDGDLAENARANLQRARAGAVSVVTGDGAQGYGPRAAYDRIIATAGLWDVPRAWLRQLRPSGRLVAPIAMDGFQVSAAFVAGRDGTLMSADNHVCAFVWMQGQNTPAATQRVIGGLYVDATAPLDSAALLQLLRVDADYGFLAFDAQPASMWKSFLPYLALYLPHGAQIVRYFSSSGDYGVVGEGFGVISNGSACFVPLGGITFEEELDHVMPVRYFGAADAYLTVQDTLSAWVKAGQPDQTHLRLRLIPNEAQPIGTAPGRVYHRRDHLLQAWLEI